MNDKENYIFHIGSLKQALNHGLILTKVDKVIQFNQKTWSKPYIKINTKLKTETKNDFENKDFVKEINNAVFRKTMDKRRKQLVSEPNYYTKKWFSDNQLAIEMKKAKAKMKK